MYPTKEKILEKETKHKKETVLLLIAFKKKWKTKTKTKEKFKALKTLLNNLAKIYKKELKVEYEPTAPSCYYNPKEKTIYLNESLSIISTLHEFAHHLYGKSELTACRWSVSLFKKTFPLAYNKLHWNGHLLITGK
jgi:Zn-dependent peptidase ImmA (M78 family)